MAYKALLIVDQERKKMLANSMVVVLSGSLISFNAGACVN